MTHLKTTVKKNNLIYDVGLHQGQDTDFYLKKGFQVIAFEANPENIAYCRERFAKAIENGTLVIVEGAIVNENLFKKGESVRFYKNEDHSFWGSTCDDWANRNEVMGTTNRIIEVKAINFSECLEKYGIPFYLKADIVGSEIYCLEALQRFKNKPDYLSIRSEKLIFQKLINEFRALDELGYNNFKAIQQDFSDLKINLAENDGFESIYQFAEGASGTFGEDTKGKWKSLDNILRQYQRIFILYWLFGDYSYLHQTNIGKKLVSNLERILRRPLPGWYDTHAKHSTLD